MAQNINDNFRLHAPKLLDDKAGPYASVAAALAGIPAYQRCPGLEVVVEVGGVQKKYWFDGGIADVDLVEMPSGGSGGYEPKNSIEVDTGELQLVGDEASPGNSKYYGTDGAGAKGFHDLPAGSGGYEPYETLIITSSATTWDAATGLNKKITTAADFTLTISNVANGMSGALALTISAETTITLITSLTELGNGSLESLAAGNYVFAFIYDGSVFYYNIAKYE